MFKSILFAIIFSTSLSFAQTIQDLIQPINLLQDQPTKVMISDLFYSDNYDVEFTSSKNVDVSYDNSTMEVSFTPKNDFSGLELISFKHNGEVYQVPVKLVKSQKYRDYESGLFEQIWPQAIKVINYKNSINAK